jgi:glyoxylase-like metal-dependent hydrolase (beta-lactamase superfamily II)
METVELLPRLHMLRFEVGQAYLWRDGDELTLIDAGPAGAGDGIAQAVRGLGLEPAAIRRIVLTHWHPDHAGGAPEVRGRHGAEVLAHRLDAPVVRGEVPGAPPVLTDEERPIHERVTPLVPPAPPSPVDGELEEGDVLPFGGGARVLSIPGHTDGSIAVHLPEHGVLFTGDTVASWEGEVILGVFNVDRARAAESFRRLAGIDSEVACFGHGDPVVGAAAAALRGAAARLAEA